MWNLGKRFTRFALLATFVLAGFGAAAETARADGRSLHGDRQIAAADGASRDSALTRPQAIRNSSGVPASQAGNTAGVPGATWQKNGDTFVNGMPKAAKETKVASRDAGRDTNAAQPKAWSVAKHVGDVRVRVAKGASWKPLKKAALTIAPGMQVKTGPDGRFSLKQGKDIITVSPNSEIEVPTKGDNNILQALGKVLFDMERRPERRFSVGTPYLAAVIKGTIFTVTVDALGSSVDVHEGAVQVSSLKSGNATIVRPGQKATVTSKASGRLTVGKGTLLQKKAASPQAVLPKEKKSGKQQAKVSSQGSEKAALGTKGKSGKNKGKGRQRRIESTLGVQRIDIAFVTAGLVANWAPNGVSGNSDGHAGGGNSGDNNGNGGGNAGGNNGNGGGNNGNGGGNNGNGGGNNGNGGGNNGNGGGNNGNGGGNNGNGGGNAGGNNGNGGGNNGNGGGNNGNGGGNAGAGNPNAGAGNAGGGNAGGGNAGGGNAGAGNAGGGNAGGGNPNAGAGNAGAGNAGAGNPNAGAGNAGGGNAGAGNPNAGAGNPNAGAGNAGAGNPNAGGGSAGAGNPNAGAGNAGAGNPNAGGGSAGAGNPNAGAGNAGAGNPNAGGGSAGAGNPNAGAGNAGAGNPNAGGGSAGAGNPNAGAGNAGAGNPNAGGGSAGAGNPNAGAGNAGAGNPNAGAGNAGGGNGKGKGKA